MISKNLDIYTVGQSYVETIGLPGQFLYEFWATCKSLMSSDKSELVCMLLMGTGNFNQRFYRMTNFNLFSSVGS